MKSAFGKRAKFMVFINDDSKNLKIEKGMS